MMMISGVKPRDTAQERVLRKGPKRAERVGRSHTEVRSKARGASRVSFQGLTAQTRSEQIIGRLDESRRPFFWLALAGEWP